MMTQDEKDVIFALGFLDGKDGKPYIAGPDCEAERECRKGYKAGAAARERLKQRGLLRGRQMEEDRAAS